MFVSYYHIITFPLFMTIIIVVGDNMLVKSWSAISSEPSSSQQARDLKTCKDHSNHSRPRRYDPQTLERIRSLSSAKARVLGIRPSHMRRVGM